MHHFSVSFHLQWSIINHYVLDYKEITEKSLNKLQNKWAHFDLGNNCYDLQTIMKAIMVTLLETRLSVSWKLGLRKRNKGKC